MKTILDQMTSTLDFYMKFFATDESKLEFDIMKQEEGFKKFLKTTADQLTGADKEVDIYNNKIKITAEAYEKDKEAYEKAVIAKANDKTPKNKDRQFRKTTIDKELEKTRQAFIKTSAAYNIYRELK